jgi:hypothetical protein
VGDADENGRSETVMDQQTDGAPATGEIVDIGTLEYAGEAAVDRALALREPLEDAIVSEEPPGPILDELFDLIRLARA